MSKSKHIISQMTPTGKGSDRTTLLLIYINVILYATCYQLQRPLEPFMVERLNLKGQSSDVEYAKLQSFFSIMQTIGSFFTGILLDRFGVKGGFIVSFLASAACYGLLSQATTLNILYLSKIPSIFQAGFLCAQAAVSQVTTNGADRVAAMGRLTMCYTIGSVIGPSIGGMLGASGDYYFGAKLAVGGSLVSVLLTLFMDPHSPTTHTSIPVSSNDDVLGSETEPLSKPLEVLEVLEEGFHQDTVVGVVRSVWLFLTTKVVTSIANSMAQAAFPLVLKNTYHVNEQSMGFTMGLMSAFNAVVNGAFLGPIVAWAGDDLCHLITLSLTSMGLMSLAQAVVALPSVSSLSPKGGLYEFMFFAFLLSIVQYVLSTSITSESTSRVSSLAKGTLLGLEHSLFAAARVVTPQIGVSLLQWGGVSAVSSTASGIFFTVLVVWLSCSKLRPKSISPHQKAEALGKLK